MLGIKDKKAFIFYFLMSLILIDFGNQIRKLSYLYKTDNSIFSFFHTTNTGSAFSMFQGHSTILAIFGIVVVILLAYYVLVNIQFKDKLLLLSLTLFNAGALGNIIERIKFGHVVDYIKLNFINFPIFNAFDIMICTGCFLYILFALFFSKDK